MILTIVILLVVIFLAFFVGKNLSNVCSFWFFKTFENLPVAVLVLIAFGVGIGFTFLIFLANKIKQSSKEETSTTSDKKTRAQKQVEKEEKRIKKEKEAELHKAEKAKPTVVPPKSENKETNKSNVTPSSEVSKTSDNQ